MMSQKRLERLTSRAIKLSEKCEGRCKHVSFLVKSNKVVSSGVNAKKTDTFAYDLYKWPFIHSEAAAIKSLPRQIDARDCDLYNFRIGKNGSLLMSKPCRSCAILLDTHGLTNVYYTTNSGEMRRAVASKT